jgi:hypothetical protein
MFMQVRTVQRCREFITKGGKGKREGRHNSGRVQGRKRLFISWLQSYCMNMGEYLPFTMQIRVPHTTTTDFFKSYEAIAHKLQGEPYTFNRFRELIVETYAHQLVYRKYSKYAKCDICESYITRIDEAESLTVKEQLRLERQEEHLVGVFKDLDTYNNHKVLSLSQPDKYVSIALDGFDTRKTQIPHRRIYTKSTEKTDTMSVPFTGALVHGQKPGAMIHYTHGEYPKDSSNTTQCVLQTLKRVFYYRNNKPYHTIFVQLDNCHRENKNRTLIWLLAFLLRYKLCKEVT